MRYPSRRRAAGGQPIECRAHGLCAELLSELVELDEWGYPMLLDGLSVDVPPPLVPLAREAVAHCPTLALRFERHR